MAYTKLLEDVLPVFDAFLEKQHRGKPPTDPLYLFAPACRAEINAILRTKHTNQLVETDSSQVPESLSKLLRFLESCVRTKIPDVKHTTNVDPKYPKLQRLRAKASTVSLPKSASYSTREQAYIAASYLRLKPQDPKSSPNGHNLSPNGPIIRAFKAYLEELEGSSNTQPVIDAPIIPRSQKQTQPVISRYRQFTDELYNVLVKNIQCSSGNGQHPTAGLHVHSVNLCLYCAKRTDISEEDIDVELTITNHQNEWTACRFNKRKRSSQCISLSGNFCQTLNLRPSSGNTLHFSTDGRTFWRDVSSEGTDMNYVADVPCSLHEHLKRGAWQLEPEAKRRLMVIIARAVAQLFGSQWLEGWTRQNLVFFPSRRGSLPNLFLPFLAASGNHNGGLDEPTSTSLLGRMFSGGNALLRQLGILLIEIENGSPVSKSSVQAILDLTKGDSVAADILETIRVYDDMKKEMRGSLRYVIELCLFFEKCPESLRNPIGCDPVEVRRLIDTHIVKPLEKGLEDWIYPRTLIDSMREIEDSETSLLRPKPMVKLHSTPEPSDVPCSKSYHQEVQHKSFFFDQKGYDEKQTNYTGVNEWFRLFEERVTSRINDVDESQQRLKIAVIDTWVNIQKANVRTITSLDQLEKVPFVSLEEDALSKSECLHGSNVVSLLHRIAPFADICAAEVSKSEHEDSLQDSALEKALNHVVNVWHADIVVMSFGWDKRITSTKYPMFSTALRECNIRSKPRVFFAAASNGGGNRRRTYPASSPSVFAVHATDSNGDAPTPNFNPSRIATSTNYSTIGHEVPGCVDTKRFSGTSFATPIAAGIAATVIEFLRQYKPESLSLDYLMQYDGMNKVLRSMSTRRGDYDYLDWADFFDTDDDGLYERIVDALDT